MNSFNQAIEQPELVAPNYIEVLPEIDITGIEGLRTLNQTVLDYNIIKKPQFSTEYKLADNEKTINIDISNLESNIREVWPLDTMQTRQNIDLKLETFVRCKDIYLSMSVGFTQALGSVLSYTQPMQVILAYLFSSVNIRVGKNKTNLPSNTFIDNFSVASLFNSRFYNCTRKATLDELMNDYPQFGLTYGLGTYQTTSDMANLLFIAGIPSVIRPNRMAVMNYSAYTDDMVAQLYQLKYSQTTTPNCSQQPLIVHVPLYMLHNFFDSENYLPPGFEIQLEYVLSSYTTNPTFSLNAQPTAAPGLNRELFDISSNFAYLTGIPNNATYRNCWVSYKTRPYTAEQLELLSIYREPFYNITTTYDQFMLIDNNSVPGFVENIDATEPDGSISFELILKRKVLPKRLWIFGTNTVSGRRANYQGAPIDSGENSRYYTYNLAFGEMSPFYMKYIKVELVETEYNNTILYEDVSNMGTMDPFATPVYLIGQMSSVKQTIDMLHGIDYANETNNVNKIAPYCCDLAFENPSFTNAPVNRLKITTIMLEPPNNSTAGTTPNFASIRNTTINRITVLLEYERQYLIKDNSVAFADKPNNIY